jgi:hypothetical protein
MGTPLLEVPHPRIKSLRFLAPGQPHNLSKHASFYEIRIVAQMDVSPPHNSVFHQWSNMKHADPNS